MSGKRRGADPNSVVVVGLGRFGGQVARSLVRLGYDVLALDADRAVVQRWAQELTHVVQADGTDRSALRQLGVPEYRRVVVGMGSNIEISILTVLALAEIGVPDIWARATSEEHARILSAVGARHVVFPESAMGERVAHLIISDLIDFIEFDETFAIAKTRTPASIAGRRLSEISSRECYGVIVLGVKPPDKPFEYAHPDLLVPADSVLVVEGTIDQVQRFSTAA